MVMCRNQTGGRWNYDLAVGEVADGTHVAYGLFNTFPAPNSPLSVLSRLSLGLQLLCKV